MANRGLGVIYDFTQYIVRKERGVFLSPSEFTQNLYAGQMDAFEEYFKQYGVDQTVHDSLRPFRVYYQFTTNAAGFVTYPSDYLHILGTAFTVSGSTVNQINFYNEDEIINALNSQLRPVSLTNPIARDTSTGFSIYPQSTQIGFFSYLRTPATPVYGYTQSGNDITYDPTTSTQLEWSDSYINNIVAKSLAYAGINMSEPEVSAFADQYNKETKP